MRKLSQVHLFADRDRYEMSPRTGRIESPFFQIIFNQKRTMVTILRHDNNHYDIAAAAAQTYLASVHGNFQSERLYIYVYIWKQFLMQKIFKLALVAFLCLMAYQLSRGI